MLSPALGRFQDAFAHALLTPEAELTSEMAALTAQPAFAIYRNTVMKGCIDALQANYPAVLRLVGEEWFRAAAAVYAREALPTDPALLRYGANFADFLTRFEPAQELPYLPGVARLDRLWTEAHTARDEATLDPSQVAGLSPEILAHTVLHPHATARWMWFADMPIYTAWSNNRAEVLPEADIDWKSEGALLLRPRDVVEWRALDAAACAFLNACAAGATLAESAEVALEVQSDTDLAQLMSTLLAAGAFGRISNSPREN
jgi:hypothetical protein